MVFGALLVFSGCTNESTSDIDGPQSPWLLVDDFESGAVLERWTNIDVQNDTNAYVPSPQISEIHEDMESGNQVMLRKPAADSIVGNRKAIGFTPLPIPINVGATYTFHTRINIEYFSNNQSFGIANVPAADISGQYCDSFETMVRITDELESNGFKNDGTLMVLSGDKAYSKVINSGTGEIWAAAGIEDRKRLIEDASLSRSIVEQACAAGLFLRRPYERTS